MDAAGEASGSPQHPRVTTITIPWTGPVSAAVKGIIPRAGSQHANEALPARRKPPARDQKPQNCRPETRAHRPNPPECSAVLPHPELTMQRPH